MEVKIQCPCGTRYKFDVEPIHGLLPGPVHCPTCGVEGTAAGNQIIEQALSGQVARPVSPPAPVKPRIRLSVSAPPPPATATAAPPPPLPAASAAPKPFPLARPTAQPSPPREQSLLLGIVGAVAAGIIGTLAWYFICQATGLKLRFLAVCVGSLIGLGARLLHRQASPSLGFSAALVAVFAILAGQLAIAGTRLGRAVDRAFSEGYEERVAYARKAIQAVPTGSDQEIRTFLASQSVETDEKPNPDQVSAEEIAEFRSKELPELKELAAGRMTKEQYVKKQKTIEAADGSAEEVEDTGIYKIVLVVMSFGLFGIVYLITGVGCAYKIATGG